MIPHHLVLTLVELVDRPVDLGPELPKHILKLMFRSEYVDLVPWVLWAA